MRRLTQMVVDLCSIVSVKKKKNEQQMLTEIQS